MILLGEQGSCGVLQGIYIHCHQHRADSGLSNSVLVVVELDLVIQDKESEGTEQVKAEETGLLTFRRYGHESLGRHHSLGANVAHFHPSFSIT